MQHADSCNDNDDDNNNNNNNNILTAVLLYLWMSGGPSMPYEESLDMLITGVVVCSNISAGIEKLSLCSSEGCVFC